MFRVEMNEAYVALLGKAIFIFAYLESVLIDVGDCLEPGFKSRYARGKPMTSGAVATELRALVGRQAALDAGYLAELKVAVEAFAALVPHRNALIHAHPYTAPGGRQELAYQSEPARALTDVVWPQGDIEAFALRADALAVSVNGLLYSPHAPSKGP